MPLALSNELVAVAAWRMVLNSRANINQRGSRAAGTSANSLFRRSKNTKYGLASVSIRPNISRHAGSLFRSSSPLVNDHAKLCQVLMRSARYHCSNALRRCWNWTGSLKACSSSVRKAWSLSSPCRVRAGSIMPRSEPWVPGSQNSRSDTGCNPGRVLAHGNNHSMCGDCVTMVRRVSLSWIRRCCKKGSFSGDQAL